MSVLNGGHWGIGALGPWGVLGLCGLGLSACDRSEPIAPEVPRTGAYVRDAKEIGAGQTPNGPAVLSLAGVPMAVAVVGKKVGDDIVVESQRHGSVVDREVYTVTNESVSLKEAAGEAYEPPITLLKFPMNVGCGWTWTGSTAAGTDTRQAKAAIVTESAKVAEKGGNVPAVKATVDLDLASEDGTGTVKRRLSFWFVEGRGVIRREFGDESVREPE
ncbi:hypothetical protein BH11ARM2_BH11ARM2_01610 [soil metagenome]